MFTHQIRFLKTSNSSIFFYTIPKDRNEKSKYSEILIFTIFHVSGNSLGNFSYRNMMFPSLYGEKIHTKPYNEFFGQF